MRAINTMKESSLFKLLVATTFFFLLIAVTTQTIAEPPFETTAGGIQFKQLVEGEGSAAKIGNVVRIHLVGWIDEQGQKGKELYNSRREQGPIAFVLGSDKVMPAWNEGVLGMKSGGRRLLMVPPRFAYGARGVEGAVPPDTSLILLIDLMSIEDE